jgi:hypothetical protein
MPEPMRLDSYGKGPATTLKRAHDDQCQRQIQDRCKPQWEKKMVSGLSNGLNRIRGLEEYGEQNKLVMKNDELLHVTGQS